MENRPSRPIKVMHIIARMNVGGPAVEIAELMRGLDPNVISQRLVTGYCSDDEADFLETQAPDIRATRINGLGRTIRPTDDAKALATLVNLIRASRPDIVHTHTTKAGVLGRLATRAAGTGAKVIHTHHGHLLHGYFGPGKTRALIKFERQLSRITDRIVTVGDKVKYDLLEAGIGSSNQFIVIHSGVRLGPLPNKQTARLELGLPDGPVIISIIGRLTRIKRPDRLVEVVTFIQHLGLEAHFLVVGGGDYAQWLRERIDEESLPVTTLGWRSDLERILAATDIVLLTSDNEGVPLSLIQASLAGVAVVATDVGSVRDLVTHEHTGLLSPPTSELLARQLARVILDNNLRGVLSSNAKDAAQARFAAEAYVQSHLILYTRLAGLDDEHQMTVPLW